MENDPPVKFEIDRRGFAIGRVVVKNQHHTLQVAHQAFSRLKLMLAGRRMPLLMDITNIAKMDNDARTFYADESYTSITRLALLTPSLVSKIIANFYMAVTAMLGDTRKIPIRSFDKEEEAAAWLVQHNEHTQARSA